MQILRGGLGLGCLLGNILGINTCGGRGRKQEWAGRQGQRQVLLTPRRVLQPEWPSQVVLSSAKMAGHLFSKWTWPPRKGIWPWQFSAISAASEGAESWRHLMSGLPAVEQSPLLQGHLDSTSWNLPHSLQPPESHLWDSVHEYTAWIGWTLKANHFPSWQGCWKIGLIMSMLF